MSEILLSAIEILEFVRWGDVPICPHCNSEDVRKMLNKNGIDRNKRFLWRCHSCKKQFTVRIGTEIEDLRIDLDKYIHFALNYKKQSLLSLSKELQISYNTALYLKERIKHNEVHIIIKRLEKQKFVKSVPTFPHCWIKK